MTEPYVGGPEGPEMPDGHYATPAEWEQIVTNAQAVEAGASLHPFPRAKVETFATLAGAVNVVSMPAAFHGGAQVPTLQVVHDAETPIADSYALSIGHYFANGPAAGTSAHKMIGPNTIVRMLSELVVGYHCGPQGNPRTIGYEQCGYVGYTRAQWTGDLALSQFGTLASEMLRDQLLYGIPNRRLSDAQLATWARNGRLAVDGGWVTHSQITRVLGGTTHTDPDPNYPYDVLSANLAGAPQEADLNAAQDQKLTDVWNILTGITAPGQAGPRETLAALLPSLQGLVNLVNRQSGTLASKIDSGNAAILTKVADTPTAHLDPADQQVLIKGITDFLATHDLQVDQPALAAAVASETLAQLATKISPAV